MIASRIAVVCFASLFAASAFAATPQQEKMKTCNQEASAKALKGDERKKFMSDCLKKAPPASQPAAAATQQDKMKVCNKEAGDKKLKGDERKAFMSNCLKK
ncbi:psiF repeat-containing protein [Formivibrio citricus]|uniref:PsiF repeat-containing protein n=1 Tax=Formivibrio citricus TaxID=83765 RepID=A0A1I4XFE9_9NEIS|nr:PsiF family protein [Formivibrio citricus]SFN24495.1 psiF repeat-containing protein [Formivibrio citricus]